MPDQKWAPIPAHTLGLKSAAMPPGATTIENQMQGTAQDGTDVAGVLQPVQHHAGDIRTQSRRWHPIQHKAPWPLVTPVC